MIQQAPPQTALACSQCGRTFAQSDLVQITGSWVCAACKPAFLSRVVAGTAATSRWHYGGFWMRYGARIIDAFVLAAVYLPLFFLFFFRTFRTMVTPGRAPNLVGILQMELGIIVGGLLLWLIYEVPMLRYWGATVGKMACGLKVVRPDGRGLGWGVSFGRFFMWNVVTNTIPYVNLVLMLISSIMAGVDDEKRALHDRVCDTRVVYKRTLAGA